MSLKLINRRAEQLLLAEDDRMPNSDLPIVIYRRAVEGDGLRKLFERHFAEHHWGGMWTDGIFGYHHFHSNAHEVLGVISGSAELVLGGPSGEGLRVDKGDVVILPAGTGHRRLRATPDFLVVGAYPEGQSPPDEYLDKALCGNCENRLKAVELPKSDPLYGPDEGVAKIWTAVRGTK